MCLFKILIAGTREPTIYYLEVYPCTPQFYYIKVGFEGVIIAWTGFPDVLRTEV